jgi:hypothetical protein
MGLGQRGKGGVSRGTSEKGMQVMDRGQSCALQIRRPGSNSGCWPWAGLKEKDDYYRTVLSEITKHFFTFTFGPGRLSCTMDVIINVLILQKGKQKLERSKDLPKVTQPAGI